VNLHISMTAPQFADDARGVLAAARFAETADLDGIFLFDHLVPIGDPTRPVLEMAATAGFVSGVAKTLTVGTLVMRAPLRGVEVSAALGRTLHAVTRGRTIVGLGAGDVQSADEARRFGQPVLSLEERVGIVRRASDALGAAGVTRWIGGTHPRVLEVAATADGWNGWMVDVGDLAVTARRLRSEAPDLVVSWGGAVLVGSDAADLAALVSRRGGERGVIAGTPADLVEALSLRVEAGATHLVISVLPNVEERWALFAERVIPGLRARWDR
jgi:alkanesulfonate monooxygenase SsuD/methylene tetrahydromethanopterin reductase-like flavin-dependent oxidoreductase (luciferase family)